MRRGSFFLLLVVIALQLLVQVPVLFAQSNVLDGVYVKEHTAQRFAPPNHPVPYAYLREADVMWSKRVWRVIDLREKVNQDFYYPEQPSQGRKSLMQVIWDGVMIDGTLTPYDDIAEGEFMVELSRAQIEQKYNRMDTAYTEDIETGELVERITPVNFLPQEVKSFRVKEDWFFDRQRSVLDVRIIGLCPVREYEKDGTPRREAMFWIYFPQARYVFAQAEVYNRANDAERRTYEDMFWKRRFSSYIYKETNVYDRRIADYANVIDALLESDRIKEEIFNFEHDLWEY
jgi:gliding motility associated protien GldN